MTVQHGTTTDRLPDDGVDAHTRGRITLLAAWLLVGVDAVLTACTAGAWFYLRGADIDGGWRDLRCSVAHPCQSTTGNPITGPAPAAGTGHLAGVIIGALVVAVLVWRAERAARGDGRAGARWAMASAVMVVVTLGLLAGADKGLTFVKIDGAYASFYWYVLVDCGVHLVVTALVLAGLANRARLGRTAADGSTFRAVRVLAVWSAVSVVVLCLVASVGA
jgi:energy-converting hydrogenase Eha subunit B